MPKPSWRRAAKAGATAVAIDEDGYPPLIAATEAPPPILYIKGNSTLAGQTAIAIVGARDASAAGRKLTGTIADALGRAGFVVASGLARGIDTAAHEASLSTGTIAVVAGGIDIIYPPENEALTRRIETEGLVIAENPPGFVPRGQDFPRRNRIISGLSIGRARGGGRQALGLAHHGALCAGAGPRGVRRAGPPPRPARRRHEPFPEAGRDAGYRSRRHPGSRSHRCSTGPITIPRRLDPPGKPKPTDVATGDRKTVLEALGPAPIGVDDLVRTTGLDARAVKVVLLELDLAGRLERHGGQRVSLAV